MCLGGSPHLSGACSSCQSPRWRVAGWQCSTRCFAWHFRTAGRWYDAGCASRPARYPGSCFSRISPRAMLSGVELASSAFEVPGSPNSAPDIARGDTRGLMDAIPVGKGSWGCGHQLKIARGDIRGIPVGARRFGPLPAGQGRPPVRAAACRSGPAAPAAGQPRRPPASRAGRYASESAASTAAATSAAPATPRGSLPLGQYSSFLTAVSGRPSSSSVCSADRIMSGLPHR